MQPCSARVLAVVCCALAAACSGNGPTAPTPVDLQFTLSPGETAGIEGTAAGVRFDRVTGDSRCPIDGVCVQGGDAIVHISLVSPSSSTAYQLHTGDMLPIRHGDLTIALVDVEPYPFSTRPTEPSEYRATFHVTR